MGSAASSISQNTTDQLLDQLHTTSPQSSTERARSRLPTANPAGSRHSLLSNSWRRRSRRIPDDIEATTASLDDLGSSPIDLDERPLFHSDHDPPVEPHASRTTNWRHSTMSRIGSRFLPDPVARVLVNSGEETFEEGQALRQGLSSRSRSSVYSRRVPSASNEPFTLTGSLRRRNPDPSRQTSRWSIRTMFTSTSSNRQQIPDAQESRPTVNDDHDLTSGLSRRRSTRRSRVRHSLSFPFTLLSNSAQELSPAPQLYRQRLQPRPARVTFAEESNRLLYNQQTNDLRHEPDTSDLHELETSEPEARHLLSTSRLTQGMSTIRRLPRGLRSRSTRLIRHGEHPPLSQVLQLAAAAIAAQLSGTSISAVDGARALTSETTDGSIQNFVQTLQEAASAQAGESVDLDAADGELPPVNFMRVFQFPNDENGIPIPQAPPRVVDNEHPVSTDGDRSVTLVLVGVRSMPNVQDNTGGDSNVIGPSLDTILSLPFLPPANVLRNGSSGALFRRSETRFRSQNRRHSMTNFNFGQQYETQRHSRWNNRPLADASISSSSPGLMTPMSESPPGPHPPPTTPADLRSGYTTPNRRPSSASAVHVDVLPHLSEDNPESPSALTAEAAFTTARQRRRSDSEFARRPELGSGSSRRNGVVEPDRNSAGRSWLIYVVGTNVSSDHPAFTMPSLFTENPSYEDMQMLSTLLGPVKPPVASREAVNAAGGIYVVIRRDNTMLAEVVPARADPDQPTIIELGERCLVCLGEYETSEEVRRLTSCKHVYHRECIDEWLLTGRNSCPMCRGRGVAEKLTSGTNPMTTETPV